MMKKKTVMMMMMMPRVHAKHWIVDSMMVVQKPWLGELRDDLGRRRVVTTE